MSADGFMRFASPHTVASTIDRFADVARRRGLTVFARIDHAGGAAAAGLEMRPMELLVFGNARGGTPLMNTQATVGIDLPLKALAWQDEDGATWLGLNDPAWLGRRHDLPPEVHANIESMAEGLSTMARESVASG
jgi:uncharacterized protein (DUF302 family)